MRDNGYEACGTERVDMRQRIIARMVSSPSYMAAIPFTVIDLRAEGDDEGADELERLVAETRRRIEAMNTLSCGAAVFDDEPPRRGAVEGGAAGGCAQECADVRQIQR